MNFKDSYKNEMKQIKHNAAMDNKILESMEQPVRKRINFAKWGVAVATMLCVAVISMNSDAIASYTEAIVGKFGLYVRDEKINLSEMTPLKVDIEKYAAYNKETGKNGIFDHQDDVKEHMGIVLTESNNLVLTAIVTHIRAYDKLGNLSMEVLCEGKQYHMNGMFVLEGYEHCNSDYGYGIDIEPTEIYEYGEGKYAYFVQDQEDKNGDGVVLQTVYFAERGIMYQLAIDKSEESTELGKKIVKYMAE